MKYYVIADVHSNTTLMIKALEKTGFYSDTEPHKLIALGDMFDRGPEPKEMQEFLLGLMDQDKLIQIRGNHDDLYEELGTEDHGLSYSHHVMNGTYETALRLTGFDPSMAQIHNDYFADAIKETPFFQQIIPSMLDYFETEHYVFVHGWIPTFHDGREYWENPDWRHGTPMAWKMARWYNGMELARNCSEKKIVVCGHWHCSFGHCVYERKGSEFGEDADFSPYYGNNVIAIDGCTARSGVVNVLVIED